MNLDEVIFPPLEVEPASIQNGYLALERSLDGNDVFEISPFGGGSRDQLIRTYTIRAKNGPIEGISEFLDILANFVAASRVDTVSFKFVGGFVLAIVDSERRYVTHIIKRRSWG